jgi:hypothetical protein
VVAGRLSNRNRNIGAIVVQLILHPLESLDGLDTFGLKTADFSAFFGRLTII